MSTDKIGRYIIKAELGRGGMSTVFHAYDPSFERDVAIKVLPAAFLHDPQFRARFDREAKMIANLEHPAIVPVYDFGEQDGLPYIVMRYMAGGSLADRLNKGALSFEETSRIISRLAPALDAAHARGIIHRDLKPGNILFDQYSNAFLSDFGIARLTESSATLITGESIVGTPAYMSPEQVQSNKTIDRHSDIYAMGVLTFQMLTGQAPYQAETPAKVMMMHLLEPVPTILDKKTDLPEGAEQIISRSMAKEPADRYSTTAELGAALEALVYGSQAEIQIQPVAPRGLSTSGGATVVSKPPQKQSSVPQSAFADKSQVTSPGLSGGQSVATTQPTRRTLTLPLVLIILLLVGGIGAMSVFIFSGRQGSSFPLLGAVQASVTSAPTNTPTPLTQTTAPQPTSTIPALMLDTPSAEPSPTPMATPSPTITATSQPTTLVLGGADKLAFLSGSNVWAANLDGSELVQLTDDGANKTSLQWTPDGQALIYVSGKCVQMVSLEGATIENLTCINYIDSLKSFDISPDGKQTAITVDNQLYIVPFDMARLKEATTRSDLTEMAECKDFAPYQKNPVTQVRWSKDGTTVAAKLMADVGGQRGNIVQLFKVDYCAPNPRPIDNFPPPRFTMSGYNKNPFILNFGWDGVVLFALNNYVRNDGFGDMYLYNSEIHKVDEKVNPVNNICCYRDPHFSPDGSYLLFSFQNLNEGTGSKTWLYYIPVASIGTGASYEPLPLPPIDDPRESPWPVLRPAK